MCAGRHIAEPINPYSQLPGAFLTSRKWVVNIMAAACFMFEKYKNKYELTAHMMKVVIYTQHWTSISLFISNTASFELVAGCAQR